MNRLPPNLATLFTPRPPLRWLEAPDYPPEKRKTAPIDGIGAFLPALKQYKAEDHPKPTESMLEASDRKKREKKRDQELLVTEGPKSYQPSEDPNIRGDAFKTLIVARLSYEADERDLERDFGRYGPIERIRIVKDTHEHEKPGKKKKPHLGYAFVVFEREKDMRAALDNCDGLRIKDRRIKVDVERGRTVKGWKPRRLGGGLGGRGYTRAMASRPTGPGGFGGAGFRGGFRGFDGGRGRGGFRGGRGGGFRGGGDFGPRGGGDFGPRGGGDFGPRGGGDFGSRGGGDFGHRGGDRFGGPPSGAPSGPGGFDRRNGGDRNFSGGGGRHDDRMGGGYRDGGRFGDRDGGRRTGSNMEPIGRREGGNRADRDFDRPRDDDSRKRGYEGVSYDDPRKLRRY